MEKKTTNADVVISQKQNNPGRTSWNLANYGKPLDYHRPIKHLTNTGFYKSWWYIFFQMLMLKWEKLYSIGIRGGETDCPTIVVLTWKNVWEVIWEKFDKKMRSWVKGLYCQ